MNAGIRPPHAADVTTTLLYSVDQWMLDGINLKATKCRNAAAGVNCREERTDRKKTCYQ